MHMNCLWTTYSVCITFYNLNICILYTCNNRSNEWNKKVTWTGGNWFHFSSSQNKKKSLMPHQEKNET